MNIAEKYGIDLSKEHKTQCPRCARNGRDKSKNNLHIYGEDAGAHCFSCAFTIPSLEYMEQMGWTIEEEEDYAEVMTQEKITEEEVERIKGYTCLQGKNTRGISDETYKVYGVRHKMSEETAEPVAQYYPITEGYEGTGFKVRTLPKTFSVIGKMGTDSDLFGQWRFKTSSGKYVVIAAGEVDAMSAYQILENYRIGRNSDFDPIPVVSGVVGEKSSAKQIQKQYEWLDRFERIVLCPDNDEAGKEAVQKIAKIVPKGKLFVMSLRMKDTNEMLVKDKEKQWIRSFFDAKPYSPDGIVGSSDLMQSIKEQALTPKIPLPEFMHKAEKQMAGGIPLGVIINLASASGTGKSTIIDECCYYWVFNSPHKIGVLTMESDAGQYGTKILSRHVGHKIDLIESIEDKIAFLERDDISKKAEELFKMPDGSNRWHLIEDRDGGLESVKSLIMELIVSCECKVIVCDPVSDLLEGLGNEDQASFCKWMKGVVKSHGVTFANVTHVRKSSSNQKANSTGAEMHEEDIFGSSSLIKSAACNLIFTRNKEAEDEIERNTTYMKMSKCRWTGRTGILGTYYYDSETHKMWDKDDWLQAHPQEF
ncbi:MAG: toprim domain-containing protein [Pseudomonadota bacterium]|nr:toprim domain-containing protein [Pseudomonadota bacterium]